MVTRCSVENCLEDAVFEVTDDSREDPYPVCRRCADELLARPGLYLVKKL